MKGKVLSGIIFSLSSISLIISLKLFWNLCIFVDEHGTSPTIVFGGDFWLSMNWLRLGFLFIICILSFIGTFCVEDK
ncbi:hypothetical protein [Clostridium cylindrosporum]|uniref:Uncharacterized protein n=1 Tax=Clostridium cylindrosporum DSM 605 TaxID=1121307 RepID=A0A0J8D7C8_CLOCY|nr:hypothetical protein [Clostridium cylindrosporum]KMT21802.1 hypothetical protein CLCY_3c00690 [Clostridium cylindrosporum DSM 605]